MKLSAWDEVKQALHAAHRAVDDAQRALSAAQQMPPGAEKFDALKKAGQLRFEATERLLEVQSRLKTIEASSAGSG